MKREDDMEPQDFFMSFRARLKYIARNEGEMVADENALRSRGACGRWSSDERMNHHWRAMRRRDGEGGAREREGERKKERE